MAIHNYDTEKIRFREFYGDKIRSLENAKDIFSTLISALISNEGIPISRIEGRIKDREECIKKFFRKYKQPLDASESAYEIRPYITDLIGIRIVCLYENDVEIIKDAILKEFKLISITNKTSEIENTEQQFGYKGIHLDLKMGESRNSLIEYKFHTEFPFELQIRSIIQDSWSVLDHKIKYKKEIPIKLKRRINTLAALFELADREFLAIKEETAKELEEAVVPSEIETNAALKPPTQHIHPQGFGIVPPSLGLNSFFLFKIAQHFFPNDSFDDLKIDGFTSEILKMQPTLTRGQFNFHMREKIKIVKEYKKYFESLSIENHMNPFTVMRHCLYLADKEIFNKILVDNIKANFEYWLENHHQVVN